jgi:hypothetical protein
MTETRTTRGAGQNQGAYMSSYSQITTSQEENEETLLDN